MNKPTVFFMPSTRSTGASEAWRALRRASSPGHARRTNRGVHPQARPRWALEAGPSRPHDLDGIERHVGSRLTASESSELRRLLEKLIVDDSGLPTD